MQGAVDAVLLHFRIVNVEAGDVVMLRETELNIKGKLVRGVFVRPVIDGNDHKVTAVANALSGGAQPTSVLMSQIAAMPAQWLYETCRDLPDSIERATEDLQRSPPSHQPPSPDVHGGALCPRSQLARARWCRSSAPVPEREGRVGGLRLGPVVPALQPARCSSLERGRLRSLSNMRPYFTTEAWAQAEMVAIDRYFVDT